MRSIFVALALAFSLPAQAVDMRSVTSCDQFQTILDAAKANFFEIPLKPMGRSSMTSTPLAGATACFARVAYSAARKPILTCQYDLPGENDAAKLGAGKREMDRVAALLGNCMPGLIRRRPPPLPEGGDGIQTALSTRDGSESWLVVAASQPVTSLLVGVETRAAPGREAYKPPSKSLSPETLARMALWRNCPDFQKTQDMLRANFAGVETVQSDGREMQKSPADSMSQCIVYRASAAEPKPSLVCIWTKYGAGNQAWAKAEFDRRAKSIPSCRADVKPVLVLPQGRLNSDEQAHFLAAGGGEAWSVGYARQGDTWYVELHAYGPSADAPPE